MASLILVTGASGKAGREVCGALGRRGMAFARAMRRPEEVDDRRFDFADRSTWASALDGAAGLFLLRPPAIADIDETLGPFVDFARGAGVRHIVFLSVAGAQKNRFLPHAAVERRLRSGPADWTILRPDFFAQNLEDPYLEDIREDDRIHVPAGEARVAFVDLADVGEAAALCFATPERHLGEAYHLTGPEAVTFDQVARTLSEAVGRRIVYRPASIPGYLRHLRRRRASWGQAAIQTYLHVALRWGASDEVAPDLARLLGRRPNTVGDYVERCAAIWR